VQKPPQREGSPAPDGSAAAKATAEPAGKTPDALAAEAAKAGKTTAKAPAAAAAAKPQPVVETAAAKKMREQKEKLRAAKADAKASSKKDKDKDSKATQAAAAAQAAAATPPSSSSDKHKDDAKPKKTRTGMPTVSSQDQQLLVAAAQKAAADKAQKAELAAARGGGGGGDGKSGAPAAKKAPEVAAPAAADTAPQASGGTATAPADSWKGPGQNVAAMSPPGFGGMPALPPTSSSNTSPSLFGTTPDPMLAAYDQDFSTGNPLATPWAPGSPNSNPSYSPSDAIPGGSPGRRQSRPPPGLAAGAPPPGFDTIKQPPSGGPPGLSLPATSGGAGWSGAGSASASAASGGGAAAASWDSAFAGSGEAPSATSWLGGSGDGGGGAATSPASDKGLWDMPGSGSGSGSGGFSNGMFNPSGASGTALEDTALEDEPSFFNTPAGGAGGGAGGSSPWDGPNPFGSGDAAQAPVCGALSGGTPGRLVGAGAVGSKRDAAEMPGMPPPVVSAVAGLGLGFSSDSSNIWGNFSGDLSATGGGPGDLDWVSTVRPLLACRLCHNIYTSGSIIIIIHK